MLSKSFFDLFGDRYGIDMVIQIVKYNHIEDLMQLSQGKKGPVFSSFMIEKSLYYNQF